MYLMYGGTTLFPTFPHSLALSFVLAPSFLVLSLVLVPLSCSLLLIAHFLFPCFIRSLLVPHFLHFLVPLLLNPFPSFLDANDFKESYEIFDSNQITPRTEFMKDLSDFLMCVPLSLPLSLSLVSVLSLILLLFIACVSFLLW
jgi:hypothetical protein